VQHPGSPIAMLTDRGAQDTTPGRYIHTKWACRSEALARFEVHWPVRRAPFTGACGAIWPDMECVVPGEKAVHFWSNASLHLNHYPTQSREVFYESKMKRGDAMRAKKDEHVRNWGYFHRYSTTSWRANASGMHRATRRLLTGWCVWHHPSGWLSARVVHRY